MVDEVHGAKPESQRRDPTARRRRAQTVTCKRRILTQTLAQRLNCDAWLLPSQSIEGSMEERNRLLASKDVADVVSRFDEVDIRHRPASAFSNPLNC
ncbi:transcriptional regulator of sorbose uptake and utilization genes [Klebsiella pneumoniae subsp. rhinoscleromatis]|nr:transcriptional regulator of sorbose uptake and utilization genes [Klebsiella pneumoniae subsp. rhinoscleromatis]